MNHQNLWWWWWFIYILGACLSVTKLRILQQSIQASYIPGSGKWLDALRCYSTNILVVVPFCIADEFIFSQWAGRMKLIFRCNSLRRITSADPTCWIIQTGLYLWLQNILVGTKYIIAVPSGFDMISSSAKNDSQHWVLNLVAHLTRGHIGIPHLPLLWALQKREGPEGRKGWECPESPDGLDSRL